MVFNTSGRISEYLEFSLNQERVLSSNMEIPETNYKDSLKEVKHSFAVEVLLGHRWPWVLKLLTRFLCIIFYPFKNFTRRIDGGNIGYMGRLVREKRYEEGYHFGVEQFSGWFKRRKPKRFPFMRDLLWWQLFDQTCCCAIELNQFDTLITLTKFIETAPEAPAIHLKATALTNLSRLAWRLNQTDAASQWVEKAIEEDDTHAPAYILRAWYDVVLDKGQPLQDLFLAIQIDPSLKESVFADQVFIGRASLLDDLERKLSEAKSG
jgi:hypothetical protein